MNFEYEISHFMTDMVGGIVIFEDDRKTIAYADSQICKEYGEALIGAPAADYFSWSDKCPDCKEDGDAVEWEYVDVHTKKYYKISSAVFEKEGQHFQLHLLVDITEYMGLNRDITKYMTFFKKLSRFQTAVLEKLSDTYYELLPLIVDYFKTERAFFLLQREMVVDTIVYDKKKHHYETIRMEYVDLLGQSMTGEEMQEFPVKTFPAKLQKLLLANEDGADTWYNRLVCGTVSGQRYAVFLRVDPKLDRTSFQEPTLKSVIRLYIENGVMREKIVYESEHDGLTGLFNKGKYLSMAEHEFTELDSIAIFNFDVNNLKKMNDQFGHEAGDRLIMKAADSIRKVTDNRVHGFRMGGDEFLAVAENVTEDETEDIRKRWEQELARLNEEDDGIHCVIAAGVAYGSRGYQYAELLKLADERMYEDKKSKKKPGEEIR